MNLINAKYGLEGPIAENHRPPYDNFLAPLVGVLGEKAGLYDYGDIPVVGSVLGESGRRQCINYCKASMPADKVEGCKKLCKSKCPYSGSCAYRPSSAEISSAVATGGYGGPGTPVPGGAGTAVLPTTAGTPSILPVIAIGGGLILVGTILAVRSFRRRQPQPVTP